MGVRNSRAGTRRRTRRAILSAALACIAGGLCAAWLIGSDDTVTVGTLTLPDEATGLAVTTHPDLTAFTHVRLRLTASADGGVFVGATHRVDTHSLLSERTHFEITGVEENRLTGRIVAADSSRAATFEQMRPDLIQGWASLAPDLGRDDLLDVVRSSDAVRPAQAWPPSATSVVKVDSAPLDLFAVPVRPDEPITVSLGVVAPDLHERGVALSGLGLLLFALWAWMTWRARPVPVPVPLALPVPASTPVPAPVRGPAQGPAPRLPHAVTLPILAALLLALSLSSCALPEAVPDASINPGHPPLTLADAARVTGTTPLSLHSPTFSTYPMWALAELPPETPDQGPLLTLVVRDDFTSEWQTAASTRLDSPAPRPLAHLSVENDSLGEALEDASSTVLTFWATGPVLGTDVSEAAIAERTRWSTRHGSPPQEGWGAVALTSAHVAQIDSGHLAFLRHRVWGPQEHHLDSTVLIHRDGGVSVLGSRITTE